MGKDGIKAHRVLTREERKERRRRAVRNERSKVMKIIREWTILITLAIAVGVAISKFAFFMINVPSGSMLPTIQLDDRIYVRKIYDVNKLQRCDIVVFLSSEDPKDHKEKPFIKRLIGLPGDTVTIKNGVVSVNGIVLKEDYVKNVDVSYNGEFKVPQGKFFFMGDNRTGSYDSRYWKEPFVDKEKIMAIAGLRVFPLRSFGLLK